MLNLVDQDIFCDFAYLTNFQWLGNILSVPFGSFTMSTKGELQCCFMGKDEALSLRAETKVRK